MDGQTDGRTNSRTADVTVALLELLSQLKSLYLLSKIHTMWLLPHGYNQLLLLLLLGVFHHVHGQDLGDIKLNKRIVLHLFGNDYIGNTGARQGGSSLLRLRTQYL